MSLETPDAEHEVPLCPGVAGGRAGTGGQRAGRGWAGEAWPSRLLRLAASCFPPQLKQPKKQDNYHVRKVFEKGATIYMYNTTV